jgi:hypothetical protein
MSSARQTLMQRRIELVQASGALRERLLQHTRAVGPALEWADRLRRAGGWLRRHPLVPAAAGLWLVWRRTRGVLRWAWRGWTGWQLLQRWAPGVLGAVPNKHSSTQGGGR